MNQTSDLPAGDVGEVVRRLDEHYWADKIENLVCLEARNLLLRLADENERNRKLACENQDFGLRQENLARSAKALLREAVEVINGLNNLIAQGQKITTETLIGQPRGLSDKAGLNALIGLLDGPEQRKAQGKANTFLAKLENHD